MQYSVVNYRTVKENFDFRIDAEYFDPKYLQLDQILNKKGAIELCKISLKISDGTHFTPNYTNEGIPFLSAINIKENYFDIGVNYEFISKEEHKKLTKRCKPSKGDVLLRKVGVGPRWACVIPDNTFEFSIFVSVAQIKPKSIHSEYISTFINSKYGQEQLLRFNKGISQPDLHLEDIRRLKIPIIDKRIIEITTNLYKKSFKFIEKSKSLYSQAEQLLLSELGLLDWKPKHTLSFVKNFSNTKEADRFDAEYFQPKYEEIVDAVKKYKSGFDALGNLVKIKDKNFTTKDNEQYKYIELANISSNGEINGYTENFGNELPSRARRKVQKGDLIVSTIEGSLESIALITEDWKNALCSTGFFAVNSDKINSETLLVLLKTKVGQLQLKKGCKGTILTAIGKDELSKIVLPKIDSKK